MICYRDMMFCPGDGCANFEKCHRALTQEVKDKAASIGLPVVHFLSPKQLGCYSLPAAITASTEAKKD